MTSGKLAESSVFALGIVQAEENAQVTGLLVLLDDERETALVEGFEPVIPADRLKLLATVAREVEAEHTRASAMLGAWHGGRLRLALLYEGERWAEGWWVAGGAQVGSAVSSRVKRTVPHGGVLLTCRYVRLSATTVPHVKGRAPLAPPCGELAQHADERHGAAADPQVEAGAVLLNVHGAQAMILHHWKLAEEAKTGKARRP